VGQIKVKLVEKVEYGYLSMMNYLSDIAIDFDLTQGANVESLPKTAETADNGRAAVTVNTLNGGEGTVRASLKNKPSQFLDLLIRVGDVGQPNNPTQPPFDDIDDDLYVVTLGPNRTKIDLENTFIATYSRACASSTVSIRLKGHTETIERDLPITIKDSIYGTIEKPLTFPEKGTYMFDFRMTDAKGRVYEDTRELKVVDDESSLKVFRLSEPPYYEDKTFSLIATFTKAPKEIDMTVTDEAGKSHKPEMRSQNDRMDWEGFFTPGETGGYTAHLDYVDGGDGKRYSERFTIQVARYYGEGGDVIVERSGGGGGCAVPSNGLLLLMCLYLLLFNRWRGLHKGGLKTQ
jgi:hypothetical protein